jgi:hypothetical protein
MMDRSWQRSLAAAVPPHRSFDPRVVGRLETEAWVAYYRREWRTLLRASIGLTRHTFGLPWPSTLLGAWLILRANQLWAPYPDNDPDGARRTMQRFYRLLARHRGAPADPATAAQLEVEWWRIHREHQREQAGDEHSLCDALTALYAYVYNVPADDVRLAARERVEAMAVSDKWVDDGCRLEDPALIAEQAALVRSYAALLAAVHRPRPTAHA